LFSIIILNFKNILIYGFFKSILEFFRNTFWYKKLKGFCMARIIEGQRRIIKMSVDDVLSIVRNYQQITQKACCYEHIRELLEKADFYVPED
jgi:hypothetical protein